MCVAYFVFSSSLNPSSIYQQLFRDDVHIRLWVLKFCLSFAAMIRINRILNRW